LWLLFEHSDENFTPKYQLKEKRLIIDVRSKEEAEKTGLPT